MTLGDFANFSYLRGDETDVCLCALISARVMVAWYTLFIYVTSVLTAACNYRPVVISFPPHLEQN